MNEKTGKILSRYARRTNRNVKELKRWWQDLKWTERSRERRRIKAELAK